MIRGAAVGVAMGNADPAVDLQPVLIPQTIAKYRE